MGACLGELSLQPLFKSCHRHQHGASDAACSGDTEIGKTAKLHFQVEEVFWGLFLFRFARRACKNQVFKTGPLGPQRLRPALDPRWPPRPEPRRSSPLAPQPRSPEAGRGGREGNPSHPVSERGTGAFLDSASGASRGCGFGMQSHRAATASGRFRGHG